MSVMAFQIAGVYIVCLTVCWGAGQRKRQSSASLAPVRGIHRWPVDSPHEGAVTRKMSTEYVMCLFGMCVGDIKHAEPRYIESPREVCWGTGIVALDVTHDVYAFPMVYAVGGWWTKPRHIGIRDTRAGDQLNVALYVKKITS